jgi:hypothetical protein
MWKKKKKLVLKPSRLVCSLKAGFRGLESCLVILLFCVSSIEG